MAKIVGQFVLTDEGLEGPADYLKAQGERLLTSILAGEDVIFNTTAHQHADPEIAILMRLQNDYAGWKGVQPFLQPTIV